MAVKKCKTCGREFDGDTRQFCSWQCSEKYGVTLRQKLDEAINDDKGHTDKLSSD